jgi:transposase-like protein
MPPCAHCQSIAVKKDGRNSAGQQRFRCRTCRRTYTERTASPFAGYRWPAEVIATAVRWYCQFRLSLANVLDLLAERHLDVSARTILSWVHTFGPLFARAVRRHARPLGARWYCDETYVRVAGRWAYLYRAVDEAGQVVDVLLRAHRDLESARAFFRQAIGRCGSTPQEIVTDKHRAYPRAIREELPGAGHVATGLHRLAGPTSKPVERSHAPIKDRLRPMRGLQGIASGAARRRAASGRDGSAEYRSPRTRGGGHLHLVGDDAQARGLGWASRSEGSATPLLRVSAHSNFTVSPVRVHRSPQVIGLAVHPDVHLVQVPLAVRPGPPPPQAGRDGRPELAAPAADALVRDHHAALEHQLLDAAIAEREAVVEAHALGDDLGGVAVATVGHSGRLHGRLLPHVPPSYPVMLLT